jgi:hypothetical protein
MAAEAQQEAKVPSAATFFTGLPWVIAILVFSFLSWLVWERFFKLFMDPVWAQYAALGMGPQGAFTVTLMALAGNWPLQTMQGRWAKGISLTVLAIVITAVFWIVVGSLAKVNLETWSFPIIATSWFWIAVTSFIGADYHVAHLPAERRTAINIIIMLGLTLLVMATIAWIPPFWFGLVEIFAVTGGFAYYFRRVKQPTFSVVSWALLVILTWIEIKVAAALGFWNWTVEPKLLPHWVWNIGSPTSQFGTFFALTGGFNFSVLALTQCWPYSTIKQPWGTPFAGLAVFAWCSLVAWGIISLMPKLVAPEAAAWQGIMLAWQTVLWGWSWVYFFGVNQTPYLWAGQKTPGSWDDVD